MRIETKSQFSGFYFEKKDFVVCVQTELCWFLQNKRFIFKADWDPKLFSWFFSVIFALIHKVSVWAAGVCSWRRLPVFLICCSYPFLPVLLWHNTADYLHCLASKAKEHVVIIEKRFGLMHTCSQILYSLHSFYLQLMLFTLPLPNQRHVLTSAKKLFKNMQTAALLLWLLVHLVCLLKTALNSLAGKLCAALIELTAPLTLMFHGLKLKHVGSALNIIGWFY